MKTFISVLLIVTVMTGCSAMYAPKASEPEVAKVVLTHKFQFHNATVNLSELIDADGAYHTQNELQTMLNDKLRKLLEAKDLLTEDSRANTLEIHVNYERRFVGDKTPIPSSALAYPAYAYTIDITDHGKRLTGMKQEKKQFKGGLAMSKQVVTKSLNDKRYEQTFINAVAKDIFKSIESLR